MAQFLLCVCVCSLFFLRNAVNWRLGADNNNAAWNVISTSLSVLGSDHFYMTTSKLSTLCCFFSLFLKHRHTNTLPFHTMTVSIMKRNIDHIFLHYFLNVHRLSSTRGNGVFFSSSLAPFFCIPRRVINMIITFYWFPIYCYLNNYYHHHHHQCVRALWVYIKYFVKAWKKHGTMVYFHCNTRLICVMNIPINKHTLVLSVQAQTILYKIYIQFTQTHTYMYKINESTYLEWSILFYTKYKSNNQINNSYSF